MKRYVKGFREKTLSSLEEKINSYAEENHVCIVSASYVLDKNEFSTYDQKALVVFEKESSV